MAFSEKRDSDDVQMGMRGLTSGKNIKDDVMLLMARYSDFEEFLVPVATSVCILGRSICCIFKLDNMGELLLSTNTR